MRDRWTKPGPNGRRVRDPERWGKGDRWQARWIENGREKTASYPTKDAAEQHLARVAVGGVKPRRDPMTVAEYAEIWQGHQLHYADQTRAAVRYKLNANVMPYIGHKQIGEVTREDVQRMVASWPGKPATVRQSFSFLTSLFKAAAENGLVSTSPCTGINLPRKRKTRIVPLTSEEVQRIAETVQPWYRAMVIVGAATGLRGSELRALTEDRVHGDVVQVDRQLAGVVGRRPMFSPPKSESSARDVAMGKVARAELEKHSAIYPPGVDGLLFTTRQGGPVNRKMAADQWRNATEKMGVRVVGQGWHALRHFHASALIRAGLSPTAVAHRLGHSDPSITLAVYAHLWPDDESRAVSAIDSLLG